MKTKTDPNFLTSALRILPFTIPDSYISGKMRKLQIDEMPVKGEESRIAIKDDLKLTAQVHNSQISLALTSDQKFIKAFDFLKDKGFLQKSNVVDFQNHGLFSYLGIIPGITADLLTDD